MKLTKRKGFNFFRSYYDVYNELETDSDKVKFIDALLARQFQGVEPTELKGMAKFAYISQVNSIDTQLKGYEDRMKALNKGVKDYDPWQGVEKTISAPPQQVQEKVQEKVQVQEKEKEKKDFLLSDIKNVDEIRENEFEFIAYSFYELFKANLLEAGMSKTSTLDKAKLSSWSNDVRLMIEKDGRTKEEFNSVFNFLRRDQFWKKNIQSTSKLREKFEQLFLASKQQTKQSKEEDDDAKILANIERKLRES